MESKAVMELYTTLERLDIPIWIDGGWGVDALLGEQTRPHEDLDIVIQQKDVPRLRRLLEARGFKDIPRDDTSAWNFVLGDGRGNLVDVHVIVFDVAGDGIYGRPEGGVMYPAASLRGVGQINGLSVRCISAEYVVKFHTGYQLRERDYKDVPAICDRFDIKYPAEYAHLKALRDDAPHRPR
jgi:lincosamide nucleotidyltransferase A/C/D/E